MITSNKSFVKYLSVVAILIAASFITCSNPASSEYGITADGREYDGGSALYCDYGPVHAAGGGCFRMKDADDCDLRWGSIVNACPKDDNGGTPIYGSCTVGDNCTNNVLQSACSGTFRENQTCPLVYGSCTQSNGTCANNVLSTSCTGTFRANQTCPRATSVIITLTGWSSTATDGAGSLDPRIHFTVNDGTSTRQTSALLDGQDIGYSWSGSRPSSPISFSSSATSLTIRAVVIEKDFMFDEDISPSGSRVITLPVVPGTVRQETLGTATSSTSRVDFTLTFQ